MNPKIELNLSSEIWEEIKPKENQTGGENIDIILHRIIEKIEAREKTQK